MEHAPRLLWDLMLTGRNIRFPVIFGCDVIISWVLLAFGFVEVLPVSSSGHSVIIGDKPTSLQFWDEKLADVNERLREDYIAL